MRCLQPDTLESLWAELRPLIRPAAIFRAERLERAIDSDSTLLLVSEIGQHTGSFKMRAAMAAALHTDGPALLTASSGNFGAALARAARLTGKACTVVMPHRAPHVKIDAVREHGASVDLIDTDRITRASRLAELAATEPAARIVSPFDDRWVVGGNALLGAEIFGSHRPGVIIAPVGGGGLSSGIVVARDHFALDTRIVGAEPTLANDAARSLAAGALVANPREPDTLCDGARTLSLGQLNFEILQRGLDGILEVSEATIVRALKLLHETTGLVAEPTGALALAALLEHPGQFAGQTVACIVSGGNIDSALHAELTR